MGAPELKLVKLEPERAAEVAALQRRCFPLPWGERVLRDVLRSPLCRGAGLEDPLRGMLVAYVVYALGGRSCHVLDLCVAPEWRRRGVGGSLIRALVEDVKTAEASVVYLEVRENNVAARSLYRALGFVPSGRTRVGYYPDTGEDALVLVRHLRIERRPAVPVPDPIAEPGGIPVPCAAEKR